VWEWTLRLSPTPNRWMIVTQPERPLRITHRWQNDGLGRSRLRGDHPPSSLGEAVNVLAVEAARLHPDARVSARLEARRSAWASMMLNAATF
jgi:hypothetical protein